MGQSSSLPSSRREPAPPAPVSAPGTPSLNSSSDRADPLLDRGASYEPVARTERPTSSSLLRRLATLLRDDHPSNPQSRRSSATDTRHSSQVATSALGRDQQRSPSIESPAAVTSEYMSLSQGPGLRRRVPSSDRSVSAPTTPEPNRVDDDHGIIGRSLRGESPPSVEPSFEILNAPFLENRVESGHEAPRAFSSREQSAPSYQSYQAPSTGRSSRWRFDRSQSLFPIFSGRSSRLHRTTRNSDLPDFSASTPSPPSASLPLGPSSGTERESSPEVSSQAFLLGRLLAIAASITASSLVGGQLSRGRLHTGSNPVSATAVGSEGAENRDTSFSEFVDSLLTGRHASELANTMFGEHEGSARPHFFRMFRFPEEDSGLVPVLVVGMRPSDQEGSAGGLDPHGMMSNVQQEGSASFHMGDDDGGRNVAETEFDEADWTSLDTEAEGSRDDPDTRVHGADRTTSSILDHIMEQVESSSGAIRRTNTPLHRTSSATSMASRSSMQSGEERFYDSVEHLRIHTEDSTESSTSVPSLSDPTISSSGDRSRSRPGHSTGPRRRTRQSWMVYVVGSLYHSSHPIFFAPSLLTDNPTYEDLLLVEGLLGDVKPATASQAAVEASGGAKVLSETSDEVVTEDRCSICLTNYAAGDSCRTLGCKHQFHQVCVDKWLTGSHNSCPLCRTQGVSQTADASSGAGSSGSLPVEAVA